MKTLVNIFVVVFLFVVSSVTAQERTITVTVVNATSDAGKVGFALYDKENFMRKPLQASASKIENGKSVVVFKNVSVGEYAVICYHDKNENNTLDFSKRGIPLEDYGASNNNMSFGAPNFHDSKFRVDDKDVSLEIRF